METDLTQMIDSALRGGAAIAVILSGTVLFRDGRHSWVGKTGALFTVGIVNYLICSASWFFQLPQPFFSVVLTFCFVNPVLFWLFARSLFDDDFNPGWGEGAIAAGLICLGYVRFLWGDQWPGPVQDATLIVMQLVAILLVAHIFALTLRGRRDDLIEDRRRFRLVFVAGIGIYVLSVAVAEISLVGQDPPEFLRSLNVLGILLLTLVINLRLIRLRTDDMLGRLILPHNPGRKPGHNIRTGTGATLTSSDQSQPDQTQPDQTQPDQTKPDQIKPAQDLSPQPDRGDSAAIDHFMRQERAYLTEGLTIGALADRMKMPEYRLRHTINQDMGFRNFPSFVNSYRLDEAKQILRDPDQMRLPILTLALDLGFGSIGPFNRAFKRDTGMTPSAYRKAMQDSAQ